ncbi:GtrA family protein [Corynebacterium sp. c3Ub_189]|uniref:GtrA family protein n=1 Tax=Corynebacterium sp. c3Ub_189 TaxID=3032331 RepID=UPI003267F2B4
MGVIGAAIDFGTMHFLETSEENALISRANSYILGSLFAYYANSVVTFSGNRSTTEKLRAFIVYTACLIKAVLGNKLARTPLADFEHTVLLSWVISQATATTLNFILQSKWLFTSENTSR